MKKFILGLSLLAVSASASADFFSSGNNGEWKMGPYGPYWEENTWPEWTPMYWMEEMASSFDDNNNNGNNFGFSNNGSRFGNMPFFGNNNSMPFFGNNGFGYNQPFYGRAVPMMPYGAPPMPYGAAPMPYGVAPMPMPAPIPVVPTAPGPAANSAN